MPSTAFPILLLGSGGREHALALKLAASPRCSRLIAAPGNPGIARVAAPAPGLDILDPAAVTAFARSEGVGLVVVGPEAPLAAGVSDALRAAGIPVFGPSAAAARLEASKAFTKELCDEAAIPTARYRRFDALEPALAYATAHALPVVVKADGLAAGKGVTVAATHVEAEAALRELFASPGAEVVIEECMTGEEVSFFVLADGTTALPLLAAQDHKRVGDGDTGPNTGGMGAYAPARVFTPDLQARTMAEIIQPTLNAMAARGTPFTGVLFAGLMLTETGPKLIEYNVRFGDPECQVLMMRLGGQPLDLLLAYLGISPRLGPIADWGLAMDRKQLTVDTATFATSVPGIYAVGDINTYPGKRKLILCGFHEATLAAFAEAERQAGHKLPLEYTTSSERLQARLGVAPAR